MKIYTNLVHAVYTNEFFTYTGFEFSSLFSAVFVVVIIVFYYTSNIVKLILTVFPTVYIVELILQTNFQSYKKNKLIKMTISCFMYVLF